MIKSLLRVFCVALAVLGFTVSATAQQAIDGYVRVKNVGSELFVQVRGAFTAQPDCDFSQASTSAGTVMYLNAVPSTDINGKAILRIKSLRCQGIEVVGQPIDNYLDTMLEIMNEADLNNLNNALWTLVRNGFSYGYTSIGRAVLESMIYIVAARLDDVGISEREELANFAMKFNKEVADNICLDICLEPVGNDSYRLFYDVPDLQCVSDWYLSTPEIKTTFEKGFESMRRYMTGKLGNTGEYLQPDEVAEMQAWGYDPTVKHHNYVDNVDGKFIYTPYEEIFADHELLFNWLKLNMIKFTDEDRCPKIELMGFYLPNFAKEMKSHALTAQLISYFPRLRTNERVYLCDGKNGVQGHLDFTSAEGAQALGVNAQWQVVPVTEADDAYLCFNPQGYNSKGSTGPQGVDGHFAAVYLDFAIKAVDPANTKFYTLSATTSTKEILGKNYTYYDLVELGDIVPARTPVIIMMTTDNAADHRVLPVKDEAGVSLLADGDTSVPYFHGTLLPVAATPEGIKNQWGLDHDATNGVHTLGNKEDDLWMNRVADGATIPANAACLVNAPFADDYAVTEPMLLVTTGIDDITIDNAPAADVIYDLQGRRVSSMTAGRVYIVNGKKILAL